MPHVRSGFAGHRRRVRASFLGFCRAPYPVPPPPGLVPSAAPMSELSLDSLIPPVVPNDSAGIVLGYLAPKSLCGTQTCSDANIVAHTHCGTQTCTKVSINTVVLSDGETQTEVGMQTVDQGTQTDSLATGRSETKTASTSSGDTRPKAEGNPKSEGTSICSHSKLVNIKTWIDGAGGINSANAMRNLRQGLDLCAELLAEHGIPSKWDLTISSYPHVIITMWLSSQSDGQCAEKGGNSQ